MADQHHSPWLLEPGSQQGLGLDFSFNPAAFNPAAGEDAGFFDGLIYNPLAVQNGQAHEGFAQSASEDFKPLADVNGGGLPTQGSWIRGGDRTPSQQGSGNMMVLHQQQLQPLSRVEPAQTAATGSDSGTRSQDNEVTAARREMKSNREKLLRDRMNEHFAELASALDPGRPPKTDKHSVLTDGVNMVRKLRDEIAKLQSEHKLLLDESKELTAEKTELREERMQVKAEKEALERRLQGMLSWMNFNPSLMMAAIANSTHPAPQTDPSANPPPNSGTPHQNRLVEPQANPPHFTGQEGAGGGETGQEDQSGTKVPPTQVQVGQREGASSSGGLQNQGLAVGDALLSMGGGRRGQEGRTAKITEGQPVALGGASNRVTSRGAMNHPTRPQPVYQAVHFGTPNPQPPPQVRGGPRRLLPATERNPAEQPRQPINSRHQQPKTACMQPASVKQSAPPPQSSKYVQGTVLVAPQQPKGGGRKGNEHFQTNHKPTAEGAPKETGATRGGHVAACGTPEEKRGQVAGSGHSEKPATTSPQPAEQSPPFQQPHSFPHPFPHMPYMGAFPGMMGMHPYSYPPQMAVPSTSPPPENTPQTSNAHFPYPPYGFGQPGNPAGYPYPMFPQPHPMAYPPFGFPHPYGAPGMGAFILPPGGQQPQAGGTGPGSVQRPSAKLAQVQSPTGTRSVDGGKGGGGDANEQGQECHPSPALDASLDACSNQQPLGGDGPNGNGQPETADSQSAKRAKVAAPGGEACRPSENVPGSVLDHVQEPGMVEGHSQEEAALQGGAEPSVTAVDGPQAVPALAVSQPSNCSSSSSGSRCGELWTQSFQSALEMPENDPTIRPPAA